jgi:hypothetical protein
MSEREVDKTPPHDCGFHRGEGASCAFHEKWNQRGVPHPDGGAPPCEECGAAITGGALECPKCGYIQQGGAPPEPTIILTGNRNEFRGFDMVTRSTPEAQAIIQAAAAFWDYQRALRVRAASRPGHPEGGAP